MNLQKPIFENKQHGPGGGIPLLKSLWEKFDLSLLFLQTGIVKHSGVSSWLMAFAYICGLIAQKPSVNQNADFTSDSPILKVLLNGNSISQSAFSRFFSKPFEWLRFAVGRIQRLQEHPESRLSEGDVVALDDTKVAHPFGKKLPFLCWLFDSSTRNHIWCMNLISTYAVLKNGLEYPLFWRFWCKTENQDNKQSKLDLAQKMLLDLRSTCGERVWVAMDRWFLCKDFFNWLFEHNFDWVTKAKRNTVLYCKSFDPVSRKAQYKKVNPKELLRAVYIKLSILGKGGVISIPDIYIKLPYKTTNRKGEPMRRWRYVPIAAIASTYRKEPVTVEGMIHEEDESATYRDAYLLISNRYDAPEEVAAAYVKRWRIEVFYRTVKQELGLTNCHSQSEASHFAHMELLFTAETLVCYARWECNKEGAKEALSHREMVRYLFNASHRICCYEQQIQVYFDTTGNRFSRFIEKYWPPHPFLWLWNWCYLPLTA